MLHFGENEMGSEEKRKEDFLLSFPTESPPFLRFSDSRSGPTRPEDTGSQIALQRAGGPVQPWPGQGRYHSVLSRPQHWGGMDSRVRA